MTGFNVAIAGLPTLDAVEKVSRVIGIPNFSWNPDGLNELSAGF
jgi:hypothetical protein